MKSLAVTLKKIFIVTCIMFSSYLGFSQVDTIYWDFSKLDSINNVYQDGYHIFKNVDTIVLEGRYVNNCSVGTWKYYYPNGNISLVVDYVCLDNGSSKENGQYIEYYKSGQIKLEGAYQWEKNDSVECVNCYYDRFGIDIKKWAEFNPSLRVGVWKEYYENGKLKSDGEYYLGVQERYTYEFIDDESGEAECLIYALIGTDYLKDKGWRYYNNNAKLVKTEYYKKGVLVGEEVYK